MLRSLSVKDDLEQEIPSESNAITLALEKVFEEKKTALAKIILERFDHIVQNKGEFRKLIAKLIKMGLLEGVLSTHTKNMSDELIYEFCLDSFKKLLHKGLEERDKLPLLGSGQTVNDHSQWVLHSEHLSILGPNVHSRFQNEFVILGFLGKGGFGKVWKVRNRLDGNLYAIKMVKFKYSLHNTKKTDQILREVKVLAQVDHPNVCRYYNAWIEAAAQEEVLPIADLGINEAHHVMWSEESSSVRVTLLSSSGSYSRSPPREIHQEEWEHTRSFQESESSASLSGVIFESHSGHISEISQPKENSPSQLAIIPYQPAQFTENSPFSYMQNINPNTNNTRQYVLYIQMQLYEDHTLKTWLQQPRQVEVIKISNILLQITQGLEYIHSKGIIHRDLKPENIFLTKDGVIKIGDLGLAKDMQSQVADPQNSLCDSSVSSNADSELTGGIGTASYASPEQLSGCTYDFKTDIYSLGIIVFECFQPFNTQSERAASLAEIKRRSIPTSFLIAYPREASVILWLTNPNPQERPTATELLANWPWDNFKTFVCSSCSDTKVLQDELAELKRQLENSKLLIEDQARKIQLLESQLRTGNAND